MVASVPAYNKAPVVAVGMEDECVQGWRDVAARLAGAASGARLMAVECYPGVDTGEIRRALEPALHPALTIESETALHAPEVLDRLLAPFLGQDSVFGFLCDWTLDGLFAPGKIEEVRTAAAGAGGPILVVGCGATVAAPDADVVVYADLTRWEIQQRQRAQRIGNLGAGNAGVNPRTLYKRGYFVDWRLADRQRAALFDRIDWYLDTNVPEEPLLIDGGAYRRALAQTVTRPFRLVPFFDPGVWGGEWMRRQFDLPDDAPNFAWCFDCVPEENSLIFGFGSRRVQSPALTLVHRHPEALLGPHVHRIFGAEFPIRFDLLDTMDGGNLSLQVHPLRSYISETFGVSYTQDESYYMLDTKPGAVVYLGLKDGIDSTAFARDLRQAGAGRVPFPAEKHVESWPARKHDHFSIPAGTVHCSGRDSVVLEISATPYIFTFKLWDWNRTDLDGHPRPVHLDHGLANIQWSRTKTWVAENLVNPVRPIAEGDGWREESTGLHPLEFIETRRHWFTAPVEHDTQGTVNVLNLVHGNAAVVESPLEAFEPFTVHYAESFVVPASVGRYRIRPATQITEPLATIKAFMRQDWT